MPNLWNGQKRNGATYREPLEYKYRNLFIEAYRTFLPLDDAIASRIVFVIASGSGGRADGRKRFWNQLSNSKPVRDRPSVNGELMGTHGRAIEFATPTSLQPQTGGRKSFPFKFKPTDWRLTIEVVIRAHWLVVKWCNKRTAFAKAPNERTQIEHKPDRPEVDNDVNYVDILCQTILEIFEELISCRTNEKWTKPILIARRFA